jgi:tetraacyldisaccharide 4'-kinase
VLLAPASLVWDAATRLRWATTRPFRASVPVICVGNLTAGGAGKTPAAMAIARFLLDAGEHPVFLTRGFGGRQEGPHLVDREQDRAQDVGDEALLLARIAPTIVAADRAAGARLAQENRCSVIIMDDGFQNPGLAKDLSLIVIDRTQGVGNGRVIPAGPLRGSLAFQLARTHALIRVGSGNAADGITALARRASLPILDAEIQPRSKTAWVSSKPVVAFAGIANPDKFFHTLELLGCKLAPQ